MRFLLFIVSIIFLSPVWAQDVHFFGSLNFAKTTTDNDVEYIGIKHDLTASPLTEAGINVSAKVDDKTQALVQVIHAAKPNKIVIDLIQVQRSFQSQYKIRIGQQRLPTFLKSEVIQVKALYPWTNAPVEVYNQIPIKSFTGGSLEKELGDFSVQGYFGEVKDELYSGETKTEVESNNLYGLRLNFRRNNFEAYANAVTSDAEIIINTPVTIAANTSATAQSVVDIDDMEVYTTGFSWDDHQWLIMSEFIHMHSRSAILNTVQAGYASLGYHFTEKYLLLGTFSTEASRISNSTPSKGTTYDLTFQYLINLNTVLKFGASHVDHRYIEVPSTLSATGFADSGNGLTGTPGNNFNVYVVQLAFVF